MWLLCSKHHLVFLVYPSLPSLSLEKGPFPPCLLSPNPPLPQRRDLHDSRLGALAVGFIIILHIAAGQLLGDIGKAAGGWWVRANCEGQRQS